MGVKHVYVIKKPDFYSLLINSGFHSAFACQAMLRCFGYDSEQDRVCAIKEYMISEKRQKM